VTSDAALAALCLAGALAAAAGGAVALRMRRSTLLVQPALQAVWILLTIGLGSALSGGFGRLTAADWVIAAVWLAASVAVHFVGRPDKWGARIAHLGIAVAAGGLILSSAFTMTSERAMSPGDTVKFGAWTIRLHEVWPAAGEGWAGVAAELRATSGDGVIVLEPQQRTMFAGSPRADAVSFSNWSGMLTASLGPQASDGGWPVRLSWTPLLMLIPVGAGLAAMDGIMSLVGPGFARWRRMRRRRLATAWWA
jgi:cytochrome c biogenesis factor